MPASAYVLLAAGWIAWVLPFFLARSSPGGPATRDRRARWGIALQGCAYSLLWQSPFWTRAPSAARVATCVVFLLLASALSWGGARALGRQWRIDAALNRDHELVRSGPYRLVRHPIYASMLCMLVATGALITPPLLFLAAAVLFIAGTEVRVRVEDALLESRFGDMARAYRRSVAAYVPFVR